MSFEFSDIICLCAATVPISSLLSFNSLILSSVLVYLTFNLPLRIFNWNYCICLCRSFIGLFWLILYHCVSWLSMVSITYLKALLISNNYFVVSIKWVYHLKLSTLKACWFGDPLPLTKSKFFSQIFCNFGLWVHLWWDFMCENSRQPRFSMCLSRGVFFRQEFFQVNFMIFSWLASSKTTEALEIWFPRLHYKIGVFIICSQIYSSFWFCASQLRK